VTARCCPGGTFRIINASSSSCTGRCSTGKYSEWPSVEDKCFSCPQGYMSTHLPEVIYTGKGCDACPRGWYQDAPGQTSCKDCGLWLWQPYTTSTIATTSYKDCTPELNSPVLILLIIIAAVIVAVVSGRFCHKWLTRRHTRHALSVSLLHENEMTEMLLGWCIQSSEIDYEKIIGRGAYGEVWLGRWKGADVAVKKIFPSPMEMAEYELQQSGRRGNRRSGSSGSRSSGSQRPDTGLELRLNRVTQSARS
jgi:hypothetical protein